MTLSIDHYVMCSNVIRDVWLSLWLYNESQVYIYIYISAV